MATPKQPRKPKNVPPPTGADVRCQPNVYLGLHTLREECSGRHEGRQYGSKSPE